MKTLLLKSIGFGLSTLALVAPAMAGQIGFKLFCYPFRAKITKKQEQFFLSAKPFRLHYKEHLIQGYSWGTGPENILLLHGWQSHSYRWKSYINALDKTRYTIYAIDAPGHGKSSGKFMTVPLYSEVIKKVMETIGKVDAIIAHSLGSFTALYTFYRNPKLAPGKLVLTASPGQATEFFDFYQKRLGFSERSMQLTKKRFKEVVLHDPEFFSAPEFARALQIPGLLIHDENDDETSVQNSVAIHQAWKNAQLVITKGKGHNLKSMEVVNQVVSFVEEPITRLAKERA